MRRVPVLILLTALILLLLAGDARAHRPSVQLGRKMAAHRGWVGYEWTSLYRLWDRESSWDPWARNPSSGACGIPQAISCPFGLGAKHAREQIAWGLRYISARYRRPSAAWVHSQNWGWY